MISERDLAAGFDSLWSDVTPLLTPSFVAVFNEGFTKQMQSEAGNPVPGIPIELTVTDHGLVAELAFALVATQSARLYGGKEIELSEITKRDALQASEHEIRAILSQRKVSSSEPTDNDWLEAVRLAKNYMPFLRRFSNSELKFSPKLQGHGVLPTCKGDLSIGATLVEIKAVNRSFAGKDLRQLIIYLALDYGAETRRWTHACLFNPRRSTFAEFSVDFLLRRISGGRPPGEVLGGILSHLGSRDIVLDSKF
jgi:hypothetical protein